MEVRREHDLSRNNTLALPCTASVFVRATDAADIEAAVRLARAERLRVFVLGAGSNLLVSPRIDALVLQPALQGLEVVDRPGGAVAVTAGAGENWHALVVRLLEAGCHGLENLALIPGTLGAAPVQNIGAYGVELAQFVEAVVAYDLHSDSWVRLERDACGFSYRHSIFRGQDSGRYVITAVALWLARGGRVEAGYGALREELERRGVTHPGPRDVFDAVVSVRSSRLPDPAQLPNAGSFFKNPVVAAAECARLRERFPAIVTYPQAGGDCKLAAAWLIEQAGFKGRIVGGVGMHAHQALVLVNYGGADTAAVLAYAAMVQAEVERRFGVRLEREPLWVEADGRCR